MLRPALSLTSARFDPARGFSSSSSLTPPPLPLRAERYREFYTAVCGLTLIHIVWSLLCTASFLLIPEGLSQGIFRAAAKNHKDVLIVVDHNDYPALLEYLKE
ncbi:hypothetical protein Zm00014a_033090 [Zea mays]|uniref:Uncharacterized protein n=1 Tax=Zea mays TaxID=4577 RepID=A0A3L6EBF4_MAIZE|nr:hypothetical protein Zm00014a_033090 [Zea mays]